MKTTDVLHFGPLEIVIKSNPKKIDTTLGQLAVDLIAALDNAKTRTQREAIQDAIELLDQTMDRLHGAGVSS
jgi:hypothetical protein